MTDTLTDNPVAIGSGKTKKIFPYRQDGKSVRIVSNDDITAGDGLRRDTIPGKGAVATRITKNIFSLLNQNGFENHYCAHSTERDKTIRDNEFIATKLNMEPYEIVVRGTAYGSYCKRHPEVKPGTSLAAPVVEFFLKDDENHDPLVVFDQIEGSQALYVASELFDGRAPFKVVPIDKEFVRRFVRKTSQLAELIFIVLHAQFAKHNVLLVDMKIECGKAPDSSHFQVGDVIDGDSLRLWPAGDPKQALDKQVYRDAKVVTPEVLAKVLKNYQIIAMITDQFQYGHGAVD